MTVARILLTAMLLLATGRPPAEPAAVALADAGVAVSGSGLEPLTLHVADLAVFERHTVRVREHGVAAEFSGFALADVLRRAGAPLGEALRGRKLTLYLVVDAADGYRAVFSWAELDPALSGRTVLLVDRRDGKPLADSEGPLRLVAPAEARPARWVRQVRALTLRAAE